MGFLSRSLRDQFEEKKPAALRADIRMISGCEDEQTSADVSNVAEFRLPDPAGRAGGACTSMLLNVLYKDEQTPEEDLTFVEVLQQMRESLVENGYEQIPQLTSSQPIDVNSKFDLVPESATGTRRAVMIGINYVGTESELSGCQNDVNNMMNYIKNVHGFEDENITILMDDGEHERPTAENIMNAFRTVVEASEAGDAIYIHYSGHGAKIRDDDAGEEADGYDESLVPVDYEEAGLIRDDDIYDVLVKPLRDGVFVVCVMDCCHSGTVLDLPYKLNADGSTEMEIEEGFNFGKLLGKFETTFSDVFE